MYLDEKIARLAMRFILPMEYLDELGFAETAHKEWTMRTDSYEFQVKYIDGEAALTARFRKTGRLSMVCMLRGSCVYPGEPTVVIKRKLSYEEIKALPDYIIRTKEGQYV